MSARLDLRGQRFGKLVAKRFLSVERGQTVWECVCDCGVVLSVRLGNLQSGNSLSCGCLKRQLSRMNATKHGMRYTRVYAIWLQMIQRCTNPKNRNWQNYGGRGITVCGRWRIFEYFYEDMGDPSDGYTLERKDNNGPYASWNCRWATKREQNLNTRQNVLMTFRDETKPMASWCAQLRMDYYTVRDRRRRGWSDEDALSIPITPGAKGLRDRGRLPHVS